MAKKGTTAATTAKDKTRIAKVLRTVPKGLYCEMAGRQHKLIDDCVRRYNLPAAGETVDLFEVITFLHNLLAKKGHRLADDDEIAALEKQKVQQQVEKLRNESLRMQLTLERERGTRSIEHRCDLLWPG